MDINEVYKNAQKIVLKPNPESAGDWSQLRFGTIVAKIMQVANDFISQNHFESSGNVLYVNESMATVLKCAMPFFWPISEVKDKEIGKLNGTITVYLEKDLPNEHGIAIVGFKPIDGEVDFTQCKAIDFEGLILEEVNDSFR
jgi:hypothetical protein